MGSPPASDRDPSPPDARLVLSAAVSTQAPTGAVADRSACGLPRVGRGVALWLTVRSSLDRSVERLRARTPARVLAARADTLTTAWPVQRQRASLCPCRRAGRPARLRHLDFWQRPLP